MRNMMFENELRTAKSTEGSGKCLFEIICMQDARELTSREDCASHLRQDNHHTTRHWHAEQIQE
jgi:hypothetical protein